MLYYNYQSLLANQRYQDALGVAQRMSRDYPEFPLAKSATDKIGGPAMKTIPGKKVSDWEMHDFDNPGRTYTHSSVASKAQIYLLEFWEST